jgi:hypothetical protein
MTIKLTAHWAQRFQRLQQERAQLMASPAVAQFLRAAQEYEAVVRLRLADEGVRVEDYAGCEFAVTAEGPVLQLREAAAAPGSAPAEGPSPIGHRVPGKRAK